MMHRRRATCGAVRAAGRADGTRVRPGPFRRAAGVRALALAGAALLAAATGASAATPPPGRAYELVSPPEKHGASVGTVLAVRPEGGAVAYYSTGAFAGALSSLAGNYTSVRTDRGWVTTPHNPPLIGRNSSLLDQFFLADVSADFRRALIETQYPADPQDLPVPSQSSTTYDLYRSEGDGRFTWMSRGLAANDGGHDVRFGGASRDLERIVFQTRRPLTPEVADDSIMHVYGREGDRTVLISVAPDGTPVAANAEVGNAGDISSGPSSYPRGRFHYAVSADGSTVFFESGGQLYVRLRAFDPDAETVHVSRSRRTGGGADCANAMFLAASRDGSKAFFYCATQLTDDGAANGVYAYDVATDELRFLTPSSGGSGDVVFLGSDPDATHVYFQSRRLYTPDAKPAPLYNVYVLRHEQIQHVGVAQTSTEVTNPTKVSVSQDGTGFAFATSADNGDPRANGLVQVYGYDAATDTLTCVSCRPDGSPSQAAAGLTDAGLLEFNPPQRVRPPGNVSTDGRVFFTSLDALVPEDTNGEADAYEWANGTVRLLSTGKSEFASIFAGASADGTDAFILTREALVPEDTDNGGVDLYSVRRGGGFPADAPPPAPCQGADCQGPPAPPPVLAEVASDRFVGRGDPPAPVRPAFTVRSLTRAERARLARGGTVRLRVRVTTAGIVSVTGRARIGRRTLTVLRGSTRAKRAGTVSVALRLSQAARRRLARGGSVRVQMSVRFTGVRSSKRLALALRTR
jgi:hypothetical protein